MVQKAYGNEVLNRSNAFRWYSRFRDGMELVEDYEKGGCPKSTWTEVSIAAVAGLVKNDRRIASRMIAETLNIPKTVVLRILKEDLGKGMLCARFVSHSLTPEQREDRVTSCPDIIAMADADKNYYGRRDPVFCLWPRSKATEFWIGWWDILSAQEIPKVPHKDHVDNFFDSQGVVHKNSLTEGKTVNAEFYKWVMDRLVKRIQRVRPVAFCWDFFLLRDNALAHKAASVCQFLTPKMLQPFITPLALHRLFSVP